MPNQRKAKPRPVTTGRPGADPSRDYHTKPLLSCRVPRESLKWARSETERRGQQFGDFMNSLIVSERARAPENSSLVAAEQQQPQTTSKQEGDHQLATQAEHALTRLLLEGEGQDCTLPGITAEDGGPVEVNVIETYKEAMLLTQDKGLVVNLSDGRVLHLTIIAYRPA